MWCGFAREKRAKPPSNGQKASQIQREQVQRQEPLPRVLRAGRLWGGCHVVTGGWLCVPRAACLLCGWQVAAAVSARGGLRGKGPSRVCCCDRMRVRAWCMVP